MDDSIKRYIDWKTCCENYGDECQAVETAFYDALTESFLFNFWYHETKKIDIRHRIKDPRSAIAKLKRKRVFELQPDKNILFSEVEDFIGFRIVCFSKEQFSRVLKAVEATKGVIVKSSVGYTNDITEEQKFQGFKIENIKPKETGYSGIHQILLFVHNAHAYKIEIQIRTVMQDAWQSVEHFYYKSDGLLPADTKKLRAAISETIEGVSATHEWIDRHISEQLLTDAANLENILPDIFPWQKKYDLPRDWVGSLIRIKSDPKVYIVTSPSTINWIGNNLGGHGTLQVRDPKYVSLIPATWESTIQIVPDVFLFNWSIGKQLNDDTMKTIEDVVGAENLPGVLTSLLNEKKPLKISLKF